VWAIAAVWDSVPVQRCTVHKHRNLLAHAPERLHEEITEDYNEMIYAKTPEEIEKHRKAFIRKWRLKHEAVANSLEEAGDRLFTFTRLPPSQWRSARTTNAIERLHEEFKRRIFGDVFHYWLQFSAAPESTLRFGFGAVYAIRPVKPSFLPVQPCAEMTDIAVLGDLRIDTWWANPATSERPIPAGKEQTLRATGE
jgi:hypothetical protein